MTVQPTTSTTYSRAVELAAELEAAGIRATQDVRNANPPCVLVMPPTRQRVGMCGWDTTWTLLCLAPGPDNADAWLALDELVDAVAAVLPITAARPSGFSRTGAEPAIPAYECEMTEVLS
jgi:hypothetical protein